MRGCFRVNCTPTAPSPNTARRLATDVVAPSFVALAYDQARIISKLRDLCAETAALFSSLPPSLPFVFANAVHVLQKVQKIPLHSIRSEQRREEIATWSTVEKILRALTAHSLLHL